MSGHANLSVEGIATRIYRDALIGRDRDQVRPDQVEWSAQPGDRSIARQAGRERGGANTDNAPARGLRRLRPPAPAPM